MSTGQHAIFEQNNLGLDLMKTWLFYSVHLFFTILLTYTSLETVFITKLLDSMFHAVFKLLLLFLLDLNAHILTSISLYNVQIIGIKNSLFCYWGFFLYT